MILNPNPLGLWRKRNRGLWIYSDLSVSPPKKKQTKKEIKMNKGNVTNKTNQVLYGRVNLTTNLLNYVIKTNPEKSYKECCEMTMELLNPH